VIGSSAAGWVTGDVASHVVGSSADSPWPCSSFVCSSISCNLRADIVLVTTTVATSPGYSTAPA
jgi:hypothetical protein